MHVAVPVMEPFADLLLPAATLLILPSTCFSRPCGNVELAFLSSRTVPISPRDSNFSGPIMFTARLLAASYTPTTSNNSVYRGLYYKA